MSRLTQDFRYAARFLLRGRFVSILAVVAFALGIGITTAVFSIFNAVLLRPLPYPDSHELVTVYDTFYVPRSTFHVLFVLVHSDRRTVNEERGERGT
jgi:hypothetical protein